MTAFNRHKASVSTYGADELLSRHAGALTQSPYTVYTKIRVNGPFTASVLIGAVIESLGDRIAKFLLSMDAESVLMVACDVLRAFHENPRIDFQVMLMTNVIKEVTHLRGDSFSEQSQIATETIRRCTLEPDFKRLVYDELFLKKGLMTSKIVVVLD